jgi:uncharacterized protein (TIGR02646 family)
VISRLLRPYPLSLAERQSIVNAGNNWSSGRNDIQQLKININTHCDTHQNERCCYCGLLYDRSGRGEIEHIAPKGAGLYPEFSFTPENLAKACQLCNSSTMKHDYNSIQVYSPVYNQCEFKIVHPYLDNPTDHYSWNYGSLRITISVNNNSNQAKESIRLFELDSEKRTKARASERNQKRLERRYNLHVDIINRIARAMRIR